MNKHTYTDFETRKTWTVKTQVIEFTAADRDGLTCDNPHIVYEALPKIGKIYGHCAGHIEVRVARAEKVMAMMAEAGFSPRAVEGEIRDSSHGSWFIAKTATID